VNLIKKRRSELLYLSKVKVLLDLLLEEKILPFLIFWRVLIIEEI